MENKETVYVVRGNKMWAYYTDKNDFLSSGTKHIECKHGDVFDFEFGKELLDAKLANNYKQVKELIHGKMSPIIDWEWFTVEGFRKGEFFVVCNTDYEKYALIDFVDNVVLKEKFLNLSSYLDFRSNGKYRVSGGRIGYVIDGYVLYECVVPTKEYPSIPYSKFRELANLTWKKNNA